MTDKIDTDFKKWLFAKSYIKLLKVQLKGKDTEIGYLKSEVEELKYLLKEENPDVNKLEIYKKQIRTEKILKNVWKRKFEQINSEFITLKKNNVIRPIK